MKKKKNNRWLVALIIITLVVVLALLIIFSGNGTANTKLNLSEKKWIENNKKEVINVSVSNNIPVFSNDSDGVFFDYINYLEENTGLSFNLVSYGNDEEVIQNDLYFEVIKKDDCKKIKDSDMLFLKDYYVLVGKNEEKIISSDDLYNKTIGILSSDLSKVSNYLTAEEGITYAPYKDTVELESALNDDKVNYIAIPRMRYLDYIFSNDYHVVYNMTELNECYVLKTSSDIDNNLKSIVKKNYILYKNEKLQDKYNANLFSLLLSENNINEASETTLVGKKYNFGYIDNEPYTSVVNGRLIGLDSTYIDSFSSTTGINFELKKYHSVKELTKALNSGKVDIAPNYYNYSSLSGNYVSTISPYEEEYVILTNINKTDVVVNSAKSLDGLEVMTINSTLSKYIEKQSTAKLKKFDKVSDLLRKVKKDSIIALDKNIYELYSDNKLADYRVIYSSKENLNYGYIINKNTENETFANVFIKYMEVINYKQLNNIAWKSYKSDSKEVSNIYIYIIIALVVLFIIWLFAKKKVKVKKLTRREETIRYIDPLTSLKNRNYLNKNFKSWENNAIYPQSIIVINLNNLRHVNDVYGHEEGDKLIKLAANVLIRNQLDQSDIIRTDGNEYLIYMVGYEKNKVVSYMRKLYKELGELPYGYGATLGYSMIEDDIKSIDDAINEAVLEIRANKEMNNKNK